MDSDEVTIAEGLGFIGLTGLIVFVFALMHEGHCFAIAFFSAMLIELAATFLILFAGFLIIFGVREAHNIMEKQEAKHREMLKYIRGEGSE